MAFEDYNTQLVARFEALIGHLKADDRDGAVKVVEQLTSEQFDDDDLPEQLEALRGDGELEDVLAWAELLLEEIQAIENPFAASEASFDIDDAFLDLEDTGFRDLSVDGLDADSQLLAGLGRDGSIAVRDSINLIDGSAVQAALEEPAGEDVSEAFEENLVEVLSEPEHVSDDVSDVVVFAADDEEPVVEDDSAEDESAEEEPAEEEPAEEEPAVEEEPPIEEESAEEEPAVEEEPADEEESAVEEEPPVEEEPAVEEEPVVEEEPSDEEEPADEEESAVEEPLGESDYMSFVDELISEGEESEAASADPERAEGVSGQGVEEASSPAPENASQPGAGTTNGFVGLDFGLNFDDIAEQVADGSDATAAQRDDSPEDQSRQTISPEPSITPAEERDAQRDQARPFDSGSSAARYAPEMSPRKPSSDRSGEIVTDAPESDDDFEGFDFDLGLSKPTATSRVRPTPPADDDYMDGPGPSTARVSGDAIDFELGLSKHDYDDDPPSSPQTIDAEIDDLDIFQFDTVQPDLDEVAREREYTPLAAMPAVKAGDDDFFELAASLAADSDPDQPYRGEPMRPRSGARNPFSHDAPTGTQHAPVNPAAQSVAASNESHVATNLNAILLEARRLQRSGELDAALDITKKILSRAESRDAEELQADLEEEIEAKYLDQIGPLDRTPTILRSLSELSPSSIDHRAGFLLSQVDGMMTYEDIIELSSMSRLETLGVLASLVIKDVIGVS